MKALFLAFGLVTGMFISSGNAEEWRTFKSSEGTPLEGRLVKASAEAATITTKTGKSFQVPLNRLSADDQLFVKTWLADEAKNRIPNLEVLVSSGRNNNGENGGSDDKFQWIEGSITVKSRERDFAFNKAKVHITMLGEGIEDRNERFCIIQQSFDLSLQPLESKQFETKEVKLRFDDTSPVFFGYKYYGYIVRIFNEHGKVVLTKAVPSSIAEFADNAMKAQPEEILDRKFNSTGRSYLFE
jgi:hypothetical protein